MADMQKTNRIFARLFIRMSWLAAFRKLVGLGTDLCKNAKICVRFAQPTVCSVIL